MKKARQHKKNKHGNFSKYTTHMFIEKDHLAHAHLSSAFKIKY
jgi:hypothetical protein